MRAVLAGACVVLLFGCWDFQAARAKCEDAGACEVADDGGRVPPEVDAGPVPPFDILLPSLAADAAVTTSGGFRWEYPYPGGPALHHLAVVNDQELWATGDDDTVLHLKHGEPPRFERLPIGASGLRSPTGARVVALPDGGVLFAGEGSLRVRTGETWTTLEDWDFSPAVAVLGQNGAPWIGGSAKPGSACTVDTAAIREDLSPSVERCASSNARSIVGLDPTGWALDTSGVLFQRSSAGWTAVHPFGTPIDPGSASVLALPGGSFLVTGAAPGRLTTVDAAGRASVQAVLPGTGDNGHAYRSLARTGDGGVLLVGTAGAFRGDGTGAWTREATNTELEAVTAGPRSEYAVGARGQVLRRVEGQWKALLPGAVAPISDVFIDRQGSLWAVGLDGTLLKREPLGWAAAGSLPTAGVGLTQTSDGRLWAVGKRSVSTYDATARAWVPARVNGSGTLEPFSDSFDLNGIVGSELGRTWLFGDGFIYAYDTGGWFVDAKAPGMTVRDVFATDAGTAWAALSQGAVLYFDGSAWGPPRPLPGAGDCTGLWGPSPDLAYVACSGGNFRVFADGRSEPWDASSPAFALTGKPLAAGGFMVIGGQDAELWISVNGTAMPQPQGLGVALPINRLRVFGSRLYVTGSREGPHGGVLSAELVP